MLECEGGGDSFETILAIKFTKINDQEILNTSSNLCIAKYSFKQVLVHSCIIYSLRARSLRNKDKLFVDLKNKS